MFFKYIFILILISIESIYAQTISVSIEPRFVAFIKKLEKREAFCTLKIQKRDTSFDAFNDIKKGKALLAIVRGDILVDNSKLKKFKIISKLKLPTYLYLVSKNGVNNAYDLLNSDEKKEGVKHISVGYLNDLANSYLKDIAKNVYSQYSFRYKYFPPKESFQKLKEGKIDSAYLFLSPFWVQKARKMKFKLQKIVKAKNRANLSKKLELQKAFKIEANGIRVDNYLIASSSISQKMLKSLISSLKKQGLLLTNISKGFGKLDSRIKGISKKIDNEIQQAKTLALKKEKECRTAKLKRAKIFSIKKRFRREKQTLLKKIKQLSSTLRSFDNKKSLKASLANIRLSIKKIDKEFIKVFKRVQRKEYMCNVSKTKEYIKLLNLKVSKLNKSKSILKKIQKEILKKKESTVILKPIKKIEHELLEPKKPTVILAPVKKIAPSVSLEREDRGF